ncbi:hypothetical protein J6590_096444 [Homalodisca vitripennis]|nr:hypothetical protein J6590_096444 [Homalodisca vitripennis]
MDRPRTSRSVNTSDPDYSDRIRRLLDYESDVDSAESFEEVDDSDEDPDYILSEEEVATREPVVPEESSEDSADAEALLDRDQDDYALPNPGAKNAEVIIALKKELTPTRIW